MRFDGFTLTAPDVTETARFYREVLGLDDERLRLVQSDRPYVPGPRDNYWKFSVFVRDIEAAAARVPGATAPAQFGDIGYLAHATDNAGNQVELIQKTFKGQPLSGDARPALGLLTLRTRDPVQSVPELCTRLDLVYRVRMHVERAGFSLYFLGPRELEPPSRDPDALENREWMYGQRELFVELQHHWADAEPRTVNDTGLVCINARGEHATSFETFDGHTVVVRDL